MWCIVTGLFMRPITPCPSVSIIGQYRGGGYRAFMVIGCALITLLVIGLAGGMAIANNSSKFSNNSEGQDAAGQDLELIDSLEDHGYYQGLLGELRRARNQPSKK